MHKKKFFEILYTYVYRLVLCRFCLRLFESVSRKRKTIQKYARKFYKLGLKRVFSLFFPTKMFKILSKNTDFQSFFLRLVLKKSSSVWSLRKQTPMGPLDCLSIFMCDLMCRRHCVVSPTSLVFLGFPRLASFFWAPLSVQRRPFRGPHKFPAASFLGYLRIFQSL